MYDKPMIKYKTQYGYMNDFFLYHLGGNTCIFFTMPNTKGAAVNESRYYLLHKPFETMDMIHVAEGHDLIGLSCVIYQGKGHNHCVGHHTQMLHVRTMNQSRYDIVRLLMYQQ